MLCAQDLDLIRKWSLPQNFNVTWDSILAPIGKLEAELMGKKLRTYFDLFLPMKFSNESYVVKINVQFYFFYSVI